MSEWHLSPLEWCAAFTALACVWLTVKNKISNWPWGIVSTLLYSWGLLAKQNLREYVAEYPLLSALLRLWLARLGKVRPDAKR